MIYSIIPNYIWDALTEKMGDNYLPSLSAKISSVRARSTRGILSKLTSEQKNLLYNGNHNVNPEKPDIEIYNAYNELLNNEAIHPSQIKEADLVYENILITWRFFKEVFKRNSFDDKGQTIIAHVKYPLERGDRPEVQWDDNRLYFGEPNNISIFNSFILDVEVVAHEFGHAVILYEGKLSYESDVNLETKGQTGALHEHYADVFGILVKQWFNQHYDPKKANWDIGSNIFRDQRPLRSMSRPSEIDHFGVGPHPQHMDEYKQSKGYHFNAGIPNYAFYLAAIDIGKPGWDVAGRIWYDALRSEYIHSKSNFQDLAKATLIMSKQHNAENSLTKAWKKVGIKIN